MNKKSISADQARNLLSKLYPISDYFLKLKEGLEKAELTKDGRVYEKTVNAYNSLLALCIEVCEIRNKSAN